MELSLVIVNWNSVNYLRNCLRSIYANVNGLAFEVIVIDNASFDGSAEVCAEEFPEVLFIQADQNLE
jgi:GT2 family glycosyltransferase